jgi:hypothetical protein
MLTWRRENEELESMNSHPELKQHIDATPLVDTHEHMSSETQWVESAQHSILHDLFDNYVMADFVSAGLRNFGEILHHEEMSLEEKWSQIAETWQKIRFTGYGEAVSLAARELYGLEALDLDGLSAAQAQVDGNMTEGSRLRLLKDVANLDHIQTDDFCWKCLPDAAGPDFFFFDINWGGACSGDPRAKMLAEETGVVVTDLKSYRQAMEAIFEKYAGCAIAVKSQHAYGRTLEWHARDDSDVEPLLQRKLKGEDLDVNEANCLGDWAWAQVADLSGQHNLPFKIHTGYYAGNNSMHVDRIPSGHLCKLAIAYPNTRFVLMHIAYPYSDELVAMTKHFSNVYADLCWAWSINPLHSVDFVRRFIHAAPINKLFAFGGDCFRPTSSVGYALQCRKWLGMALGGEVEDGLLTLEEAKEVATRLMHDNQYECFDIEGTRAHIHAQIAPHAEEASVTV